MSKTIKLNDIDNDIFNVISNIKFYPRTEITHTHRGTVDDHIEMVICYKVDECKYVNKPKDSSPTNCPN